SGRKNSLIACRQVPQGGTGLSVSATTTIFLKDISPAAIAENKATRSAQHVTGYAAFSMLHPTNTFPVDVNSAAPTANLEYCMYAYFLTAFACSISVSVVTSIRSFLPFGIV